MRLVRSKAVCALGAITLGAVGLGCASQGAPAPASASSALAPILDCEAVGRARPICGFQNPEDLVALPGGEAVLVSEYGSMQGDRPGALSLFVLENERRHVLFRGGDAPETLPASLTWGDPACPGPPPAAFSPHGIHLSKRSDGRFQLLVVQHGGRESVEFFEVIGAGTKFAVEWRGCAVAPADAMLNSVAALPDGGFVTTHMMPRSAASQALAESFATSRPTGAVLEWTRAAGFRVVPNTQSVLPNGIEVSADGRVIFVNSSGPGEIRRIERSTGTVEAQAAVSAPDNVRWAPDGRLLVASLRGSSLADFAMCLELEAGACPMPFQIVAVDPDSMQTEVLYANQGPPMGGGTVGLQIGRELLIGSFAGDRILRVSLDASAPGADAPVR